MSILERSATGKLTINHLDAQILFGDIFALCDNENEIARVLEQLMDILDGSAEEREREL